MMCTLRSYGTATQAISYFILPTNAFVVNITTKLFNELLEISQFTFQSQQIVGRKVLKGFSLFLVSSNCGQATPITVQCWSNDGTILHK